MKRTIHRRSFLKQGIAACGGLLLSKNVLAEQPLALPGQSAFLFDSIRCTNCGICERTCRRVNGLPEKHNVIFMSQQAVDNPVHIITRRTCMQCLQPACVRACPTEATSLGPNGLIGYDDTKCAACGYCVDACPFQHPRMSRLAYFDLRNVWVNRCTSCGACAQACPESALFLGFRNEIISLARSRLEQVKSRYPLPDAQIYGEQDLNLIWILADHPEVYGLPPSRAAALADESLLLWKSVVRPGILALSGLATAVLGSVYFFALRNHKKELKRLKEEGKI